uniref:NADH-ubiquinone oxidoreductase chain 2 n=1 Tax=Chilodus punctatus TaxID=303996 RepID=F7UIG8_9TELE|nr:NADH dehydrogenase subunit 2 [Chilodus punctatus]BAK42032.1 NADH dehydrogenase subunit 2 [Chilodus punctatus]
MSPYVIMILLFSLGLGTTLTFASSHWLLAWMGLEINTMAILPLMIQHHHPRAAEATIKYFLTQATAAAMILFASTINAWLTGQWDILHLSHPLTAILVTLGLALKLGLAPLHFWLPGVMQGLDLTTGLIMTTWQKLAPLALLIQMANTVNPTLLFVLGLSSTLIGGWAGLNQTELRKIMAYSSIAHLGWMIIIIQFAPQLTLLALAMYVIMTSAAFLTFKSTNTTKIKTLALAWSKNPTLTITTTLVLLSLGGLPPLTGFMPKWLILQELTNQGLPLTATLMALSALLSLYFYLRLCYVMTLMVFPAVHNLLNPWPMSSKNLYMIPALTTSMTILMLPITPLIMAMAG